MIFAFRNGLFWDWAQWKLTGTSPSTRGYSDEIDQLIRQIRRDGIIQGHHDRLNYSEDFHMTTPHDIAVRYGCSRCLGNTPCCWENPANWAVSGDGAPKEVHRRWRWGWLNGLWKAHRRLT